MPKFTKRYVERCLADLARELEACPPWLLAQIIEGLMEMNGCSEDEAIRELAQLEATVRQLLDASQRMGEA